jgi:hypothetical protein
MIFKELLEALVGRLQWDAYFSDPATGVAAIGENRMELVTELDNALAKCGIGALVAIRDVRAGERASKTGYDVVVTIVLEISEVPLINRGLGGAQKWALDVGTKAMSLWGDGWCPGEMWSPMEFKSLGLTGFDDEHGRLVWTLEMETRTFLETAVFVLADEEDEVLSGAESEALLTSPTEP